MKLISTFLVGAIAGVHYVPAVKKADESCIDFELGLKCEGYCTESYVICLSECNSDQICQSNCARDNAECSQECPCNENCLDCDNCDNPICNCRDWKEQDDWKSCTDSKCSIMTDCGLECDSNQCILDCWAKFLDAHRDCPCETNCPNGCPCDSYECNGISPGFEIAGPITIGESQKVEDISDYGMNFDFSFDFKMNSIPDGYGHVLQVGQTEVSSYEDSMAFLFYNKNDYFQVFVRGMEPKGIFPTVTLDLETWNQIQIIHTKLNSAKCQIEFLVNSESFFEFVVDCVKSMKNNQVFLAGSEENAKPYPGEIRNFKFTTEN